MFTKKSRWFVAWTIGILFTIVILSTSGCEIFFGSNEQKEIALTQTALSEQLSQNNQVFRDATQNAEIATRVSQETQLAEKEALEATLQSQQETISAQQTTILQSDNEATQQFLTPSITNTPTSEAVASIFIVDWNKAAFIEYPEGCMTSDNPCWKTDDNKVYTGYTDRDWKSLLYDDYVDNPESISLTSKDEIFIDSDWKTPHLVFWHQYNIVNTARIVVKPEGEPWAILKIYNSGKLSDWNEETLDLSPYKGKSIRIQFVLVPHKTVSSWWIEGIQIIPNYIAY